MASRDMKTDIFQEGSAGFKATIGLNKKKVHQSDVSAYVENVEVISVRQTYNYKEHEGKRINTDGSKLMLNAPKLAGIIIIIIIVLITTSKTPCICTMP
jgi:hypothetical protein